MPPVSPSGDKWLEMGSLDRESEWSSLLVAASGGERRKAPPLDWPDRTGKLGSNVWWGNPPCYIFLVPNLKRTFSPTLYHKPSDISYPNFWSAFFKSIHWKILLLLSYQ